MDFSGQTVLVTGAAGTVGRAVAMAFHSRGAQLALIDLDERALLQVYAETGLTSDCGASFLALNLLDKDALSRQIQRVPQIDVLCNIAGGFTMGSPVHETGEDTWLAMININASTILSTARAVVPAMLARGSGRIINVAAGAALCGAASMGAYAAAKSAVLRLTESMSAELRERGIHVNCVLPSIVDTPQNRRDMPAADHGRWVSPAALADVIVFLASPSAAAIHGACIPVRGLS